MAEESVNRPRAGTRHELASIGGRAAATAVRPFTGALGAAAGAGIGLQRRAIDRILDSGELEHLLASPRLQNAVEQVLDSEGAKRLIDHFFESGLFERFIDRLLVSDALWRLVDDVAQSPSVTAAVSQQGLGFADQVGAEVRGRSRKADDWLERFAQGLIHRRSAAEAEVRERPAQ